MKKKAFFVSRTIKIFCLGRKKDTKSILTLETNTDQVHTFFFLIAAPRGFNCATVMAVVRKFIAVKHSSLNVFRRHSNQKREPQALLALIIFHETATSWLTSGKPVSSRARVLYINRSINQSTNQREVCKSFNQPINLYLTFDLIDSTNQSINQSTNQREVCKSFNQPINLYLTFDLIDSTNQSINQSIDPSTISKSVFSLDCRGLQVLIVFCTFLEWSFFGQLIDKLHEKKFRTVSNRFEQSRI